MIVQEPVQAAIWHALNHYAYADAIFLAERLYAELGSDDALFLLATCYYRAGKVTSAYSILHSKGCHTSQCRFLLARCCVDLKKYSEAELALTGSNVAKSKSMDDIPTEFLDSGSFSLQLLGHIFHKTERKSKAGEAFKKSLKLNPFLWSSYEYLVNLGERPDPSAIFSVSTLENFNMCNGSNPLINLLNRTFASSENMSSNEIMDQCKDVFQLPSQISKFSCVSLPATPAGLDVVSPVALIKNSDNNASSGIELVTPEQQNGLSMGPPLSRNIPAKCMIKPARGMFGGLSAISPLTPSFGVFPLDSSGSSSCGNVTTPSPALAFLSPSPANLIETHSIDTHAAPKKQPMTRRTQTFNPPKFQIFNQSGNTSSFSVAQTPSQASLPTGGLSSLRRSSRLFSSSNSVKENNKSPNKSGRLVSPKMPLKKTKTRSIKVSVSQKKESEMNELNKVDKQPQEGNKPAANAMSLAQTALSMQKWSAENLMLLLQELGWARLYLGHYCCKKAIEILSSLPPQHFYTGWVLGALGRAHFELAEYKQSVYYYKKVREIEPHRLQGLEYYSTALWHLQQEVALSSLAQELTELDKNAPETWCVSGNCFSLQKEHETAIKFLQRAIQVDPDFAYAYTLLGHEHVFSEEMDHALSCFRNAIRLDPRHYNAWYGVGMIYYKQEKFGLAETHFKRALMINPQNSVIMCHVGVVQHALKKTEAALETLNKAIGADPRNPLCKFHRATIYFSIDKHQQALRELEELKEIVPKESLVYFLIGKVHKKLGNTHLALMNFSWAMDLDPRGATNTVKEAIDKHYTNEDDDTAANAAAASSSNHEPGDELSSMGSRAAEDHESSHESSMVDAEDANIQSMESDESF